MSNKLCKFKATLIFTGGEGASFWGRSSNKTPPYKGIGGSIPVDKTHLEVSSAVIEDLPLIRNWESPSLRIVSTKSAPETGPRALR